MKLKILITELAFQTLLSIGCILYMVYEYIQKDQINEFFLALFFVGTANLLGFVIRILIVASHFHRYYFFGVVAFFLLLYALVKFESEMFLTLYFMGIGGILFNIYYLIYGFLTIRKLSDEIEIKS